MKIESPTWQIKVPCTCCGQGSPTFVSCQTCGYITVHCDEMGNTFSNPKNLNNGFISLCPTCQTDSKLFLPASSDQIVNAGFSIEDYE